MGKINFKISSRATILLGRESVSKVDGAIIELVKNTYDADSTLCFICFDIEHDCIYLLDNGVGMTMETIENHWMMIGTDNKRENFKSGKNRIKSGEKGIGRFALDRLGSKCEMFTKNEHGDKVILWKANWEEFEQLGKTIDEIEADFDFLDSRFKDIIPSQIYQNIMNLIAAKQKANLDQKSYESFKINLDSGTLFRISNLRDKWTDKELSNILNSMGFLIPPSEQKDYILCVQKNLESDYIEVENGATEEFDYKLNVEFDGTKFIIEIDRNEFDLNRIPREVFQMDRFKVAPYTYDDFKNKKIKQELSISELMKISDIKLIKEIKQIGAFEFKYTFMKLSLQDDSKETFFYKEISKKRKLWLEQHGGIKIYRDNFLVRPYGDIESDSFDWLGLDAKRATNPAAISHPSGNWHVRNAQGQGTILISRIHNDSILDKSSREGIIENEYFKLLKDVIKNLISIFEKDRAYIGLTMKMYSDTVNEKEKTKEAGKKISKAILSKAGKKKDKSQPETQVETLSKSVKFLEEEVDELITEIKLYRSLATNGLITTSIVHDLKGINAILVNRVSSIQTAFELNNSTLITRNLEDLKRNDTFLKSWITVITNLTKKDKRTRQNKDFYAAVEEIIAVLNPILVQKQIKINIKTDSRQIFKRIFISDFESIIYNLIINSIESFEKTRLNERIIDLEMENNGELIIHYRDNGKGLDNVFKDPYDIFNFGITSKYDINGEPIGTGLGMYIVASTTREYNGQLTIITGKPGFGLDLKFPL